MLEEETGMELKKEVNELKEEINILKEIIKEEQ
jgi:hypothetical protein